jgi:putative flippase GtrA
MVNTAFGYGTYAGLTALFTPYVPYAYMLACLIAYFLNITFSFLNYKWFIFKTKGNYIREWSRCVLVYASTVAIGLLILPVTVTLIRLLTTADRAAPYIGGAIQMVAISIFGYLGHTKYSFAPLRSATRAKIEK